MDAGTLISGKYRLQRLLGAGSMGAVWAARNELTNRDFAVKFLRSELSKNQEVLNRFFLEARACGQIRHPAIVDVYDMGQADDGAPYLVMELLEGEGFDQRLERQGTFRPADVCRYMAIVSSGLEEAHARGLIHRDLKPGNVFFAIDKGGEVLPKVLDFGISKETRAEHSDFVRTSAGTVLGSPAYMSPEQARGEGDVDARTDIWALGTIMYEALTGTVPFDAANYNALMLAIISEPHTPVIELRPDCPSELSALVDQLLAKDRDKRIGSAALLAQRLESIHATLTGTALAVPERSVSLPPLETQTQNGWFKVRNAAGAPRISPSVIVGACLGLVGVVGAGVALTGGAGGEEAEVGTAVRVGKVVNMVVSRARSQHSEAMAELRTKTAEAAARAAEARAEKAERSVEKTKEVRRRNTQSESRPKQNNNDPHGGVVGPGF